MESGFTLIDDLASEVEVPEGGILSRTVYNDDSLKVILFAFDTGQELSEHTASMPAILHLLSGEADLTLGDQTAAAHAGTWLRMAPNLPHSVVAKSPLVFVLLLLKSGKS